METPIKLVSWGHLAELSNLVNSGRRDWAFFKADHDAAYKQLPTEARHSQLAVIALRSPSDKRGYGSIIRAMVFGAVADVLHYNVLSRKISEIPTQLFGAPLRCFFDDFGAMVPGGISEIALKTLSLFCPNLGIKLKIAKSEFGRMVTFHRP